MARPRQDGLLYFSFDTDFFYADSRIKRLQSKFGNDGLIFYIYLLTEIYRNGYYIRWDEETAEDISADLHLKEGFIEQVLTFLFTRSLLVKRTLATQDTVITSPGIQKRYQEAKRGSKRQMEANPEIWLLSEEETASCIKVANNMVFSEKNQGKSEKNQGKSEKNIPKEKESKINKNKEKEKEIPHIRRFGDFWNVYPNKQRRYLAEKAYCDVLLSGKYTEDDLVSSATNYAAHVKESGDKMFLPNNFLEKCVFEDYLETKCTEPTQEVPEPEEELVGNDEEWWKYGPNGWEE